MTKIIMHGCNGKMGEVISKLCINNEKFKIVAGLDINDVQKFDYPVYSNYLDCTEDADVIIDFSNPLALENLLAFTKARKLPLALCTTGLGSSAKKSVAELSQVVPVLQSANTSIGVNLLIKLAQEATEILQNNFDIEIIEKHHNQKIDAPSGTALSIAEAINDVCTSPAEFVYDRHSTRKKRSKSEIGIHSIRGGSIVGEHTVLFAGNDELIEIKHTALSKNVLGLGALEIAEFLKTKNPGLYSMNDLFNKERL